MAEGKRPPSLDDLEARLQAARARETATKGGEQPGGRGRSSGLSFGFRIAVELVAGVMVGFGIGYGLDSWLGTGPILMVLFLFLGGAAGVMNIFRAVRGMDESVGLGGAQARAERRRKKEEGRGGESD